MPFPYPHIHLLVSGGNTQLIYLKSWKDVEVLGQTKDDAAGECFDKVGRMLGLPYPGGVYLSKIAGLKYLNNLKFPVGMKNSEDYNFSFSGLKTAVKYYLEKQIIDKATGEKFELEKQLTKDEIQKLIDFDLSIDSAVGLNLRYKIIKEVCISTQTAIVDALTHKVFLASKNLEFATIGLSGGVSASPLLRLKLEQKFDEKLLLAPKPLTGDNAIMIGLAGILSTRNNTQALDNMPYS